MVFNKYILTIIKIKVYLRRINSLALGIDHLHRANLDTKLYNGFLKRDIDEYSEEG